MLRLVHISYWDGRAALATNVISVWVGTMLLERLALCFRDSSH